MKNILLAFLVVALSGCAVNKQQAPIEYHHSNSNLGGARSVNENTVSIISNDGEVISSDLKDSEKLEIIEPNKVSDENNIMPEEKPLAKQEVEEAVDEDEVIAPKPVKIVTTTEEAPKKQLPLPGAVDYMKPVEGAVITKFGEKTEHGANKGINISAPEGTKVIASASGKVIYADYDATFGNLVIIKLDNKNIVLSYAHMEDLMVSKGVPIKQGEIVGYVGSTGKVKGPQLHFAMREGKNAIDPLKFVHY